MYSLPIIPGRNHQVLLPGTAIRLNVASKDTKALVEYIHKQVVNNRSPPSTSQSSLTPPHSNSNSSSSSLSQNSTIMVGFVPQISPDSPTKEESTSQSAPSSLDISTPTSSNFKSSSFNLNSLGVVARVLNITKHHGPQPDFHYSITIEAMHRIRLCDQVQTTPFLINHVQDVFDIYPLSASTQNNNNNGLDIRPEVDSSINNVSSTSSISKETNDRTGNNVQKDNNSDKSVKQRDLEDTVNILKSHIKELMRVLAVMRVPSNVLKTLEQTLLQNASPSLLADLLGNLMQLGFHEKLAILNELDVLKRVSKVDKHLVQQLNNLKRSKTFETFFQSPSSCSSSSKNTGATSGKKLDQEDMEELDKLAEKLNQIQLLEDSMKMLQRDFKRLKRLPPHNADHQVIRTYLEWVSDLPWHIVTEENKDVLKAKEQLDMDHFGLFDVKKRIIEYLAVKKLTNSLRGPILCFVGPPGVGKTSLGKSIAKALGKKFYRIPLGGVRDEHEVRGHRRTYVGALPGLIIQSLKKSSTRNPVFLLDEIDKLSKDARGDPASALLEVLDPEQNSNFHDHYLNIPFDLSQVLFIATANSLETIPSPLLDRMEVIRIPGYTFQEKVQIAKSYIVPKQLELHGLQDKTLHMDTSLLLKIVSSYTREAGVRDLERHVAAICRTFAVERATFEEQGKSFNPILSWEKVQEILGIPKYKDELLNHISLPGVVIGLVWTSDGAGGILFIESTMMPNGSGKVQLTGHLGNVIQESANLAVSWVRSNYKKLESKGFHINPEVFQKNDIHIHFPSGGIPKDGPSAGIAIITSLVSLLSNTPIKTQLAMTGEITLRGQVLPIGGVKEKILAGHRCGIKTILLPSRNKRDLTDIPQDIQSQMTVKFVDNVWEVIEHAFGDPGTSFIVKERPLKDSVKVLSPRL